VKINRLAQLIGDTLENVNAALGEMIDRDLIEAEIDQPEKAIIFLRMEATRDRGISKFCATVGDLTSKIKEGQ
jgi:hypothetical protein